MAVARAVVKVSINTEIASVSTQRDSQPAETLTVARKSKRDWPDGTLAKFCSDNPESVHDVIKKAIPMWVAPLERPLLTKSEATE